MSSKVLVIHDSRYGSTEGIANEIAAVLRDAGRDVIVVIAKAAPDPAGFDFVVAGSPIYASRIRSGIVAYFERYRARLVGKPCALFAVAGSLADNTDTNREAARAALAPLEKGVEVRSVALFAGVVDPKKLPWPARLIVRAMGAKAGDFRDWEAIRAWAGSLLDEGEPAPSQERTSLEGGDNAGDGAA